MEQFKNKSLRSSGFRSKNGFSIRNKMKKNESRWMNSLPFTLVATNKNLSKSLYGLTMPITKIYNDVPFVSLKNTSYVSFDYENYCHTDIDISKLIEFKKARTKPTRYKSHSAPNYQQPLMQLSINLKRIQLTDLLKFKLSQGSRSYLESLLSKVESNKLTETVSKANTAHKISNLTIEKYNSNNNINEPNLHVKNDNAENEITNTTNNSTASHTKTFKMCQNLINESKTNEDIYGINHVSRRTGTQNHDSLINDFEIRDEIDNSSNNKIMNKEVLLTISNLNPNSANESWKLKRSLSKQQLIGSKNSNKRLRSIDDFEQSYRNLEISTSNITNLIISSNQSSNQVITESKTSQITYNEFIAKNKKIQLERKHFGKTNFARNNNASSKRPKNTNEIEMIDLTI